jgi:hypothetical protein
MPPIKPQTPPTQKPNIQITEGLMTGAPLQRS